MKFVILCFRISLFSCILLFFKSDHPIKSIFFDISCVVVYAQNFQGGAKFHHNFVMSQINFRESAKGTTMILRGLG